MLHYCFDTAILSTIRRTAKCLSLSCSTTGAIHCLSRISAVVARASQCAVDRITSSLCVANRVEERAQRLHLQLRHSVNKRNTIRWHHWIDASHFRQRPAIPLPCGAVADRRRRGVSSRRYRTRLHRRRRRSVRSRARRRGCFGWSALFLAATSGEPIICLHFAGAGGRRVLSPVVCSSLPQWIEDSSSLTDARSPPPPRGKWP